MLDTEDDVKMLNCQLQCWGDVEIEDCVALINRLLIENINLHNKIHELNAQIIAREYADK